MKLLTALGNQYIQDSLKKSYTDIEFLLPDLAYQEGILEALKVSTLDALIISLDIEGDLEDNAFIEALRSINSTVKIVLILKEEDKEFINWLISKGIFDVFIDGQCTFEDIYQALCREQKVIIKKEIVIQKSDPVIKEKIVTQERIVMVGFKKLVLPVIASSEVACELAYCTARITGQKVLLINLDEVMGYMDIYLGVETTNKDLSMQLLKEVQSGKPLNATAFELCSVKVLDNLLLLDMVGLTASQNDLQVLINGAYGCFDITIVSVPWEYKHIKTIATLGDAVIAVCRAFMDEWSAALKRSEKLLLDSIPPEKLMLVFHEYKNGIDLPEAYMKEQLGQNFLGKTLYYEERCKARNRRSIEGFYSELFYPFIKPQYARIIERFNLFRRPSAISSIKALLFKHTLKEDGKEEEESPSRQDIIFSLKEAAEILRYICYTFSKAFIVLFQWLFINLKQIFHPFNILLLLLFYVVYRLFKAGGYDLQALLFKIFK